MSKTRIYGIQSSAVMMLILIWQLIGGASWRLIAVLASTIVWLLVVAALNTDSDR
jgi:hypothetical protein